MVASETSRTWSKAENILKRGLGGINQVQNLATQGMSILNNVQSLVKNVQGGNVSGIIDNITNLSTPLSSFGTVPMLSEVQTLMGDVRTLISNLKNSDQLTPDTIKQLTAVYGDITQFLKTSA